MAEMEAALRSSERAREVLAEALAELRASLRRTEARLINIRSSYFSSSCLFDPSVIYCCLIIGNYGVYLLSHIMPFLVSAGVTCSFAPCSRGAAATGEQRRRSLTKRTGTTQPKVRALVLTLLSQVIELEGERDAAIATLATLKKEHAVRVNRCLFSASFPC